MRSSAKIIMSVVLSALSLSLISCGNGLFNSTDRTLGPLAREVADRAQQNDVQYFMALSPARERVPELIAQIGRSGIATNYAEHLVMQTATEGSLNYGVNGDATPGTSFAILLSFVEHRPRIDQIVEYQNGEQGSAAATPAVAPGAVVPSRGPDRSTVETVAAFVAIASDQLAANTRQGAFVGYINTSSTCLVLAQPLDVSLRIADRDNRLVSTWTADAIPDPLDTAFLMPWDTIYGALRFQSPEPGHYLLYGSADGVQTSPVYFGAVSPR